jgi:hypothetical protein
MVAPEFGLMEEPRAIKNPSERQWGLKICSVTKHLPQIQNPTAPHNTVDGKFALGKIGARKHKTRLTAKRRLAKGKL